MCNLCHERLVVHEQKVDFARIVDEDFFVTVRKEMACFLVASVPNLKSHRMRECV
jgi:hypothetical protein